MLVLLVASGLHGSAQQRPSRRPPTEREQERETPTEQQHERKIAELAVQESDPEALRIAVPQECARIRPDVQIHDAPDNFNPPGAPVTLSTALTNWLNTNNFPRKGYDDRRENTFFADSFRLRNCRVCYATLEVRVRHYTDIWSNDSITVGVAPFYNAPGLKFIHTGLWSPPGPNPKTLTYALPAAALNSFLMSGQMPSTLDVSMQDDTDVDYAKLSVYYH
jgi:hypothetical protein